MLTNEKETMLNKVLQLENWLNGYLTADEITRNIERGNLQTNIKRNLNSIKSLINKS